jgi:hypothetical protein
VLECLTGDFRELLKQFEGGVCPLCGVLKRRESQEIEQLRANRGSVPMLCGARISILL